MKVLVAAVLLFVAAAFAENQCPAEQEADWSIELLLRHEDCNKFYKCTFGQPVEQSCWGDLYFNLDTWECDWQENVDCTGRNVPGEEKEVEVAPEPESVEEAAPEPEEEVEAAPEPEEEVEAAPEPEEEVEAAPEPEEEVEAAPEPEVDVEETTTAKQEPEPEQEIEAQSEEEEGDEETSVTEQQPETEEETEAQPEPEEESEIEFLENGCPVDPHVHWLLPHETECNQFYYCVWGEKVLRDCSGPLHFNRVLQVCDWPADAGCTSTTALNKHYAARVAYRK